MTKARDIADFKFENIVDTGTEGTKVASGTSAQRGSTAGQLRFNSETGLAEYYTGTAFKPIDSPPTVLSIDDTEVDSAGGGNQTIVITGTNFQSGATVTFVGTSANFNATTVTVDSETQITAVAPKASFLNAQEPYGVRVANSNGLSGTLASQINVDNSPVWQTASGTIYTGNDVTDVSVTVSATDPEGETVSYSETTSVLAGGGFTLNSSTGEITGTPSGVTADTTYTFTLRATSNGQTADRQFSIVITNAVIQTFSYTGSDQTFTVPSGVTSFTAYMWGGAGASGFDYSASGGGARTANTGGAGGFTTGTVSTSAGTVYKLVVGQGGTATDVTAGFTASVYGGGGRGRVHTHAGVGGGGGGLSGIFLNSFTHANSVLIAGGGGGSPGGNDGGFTASGNGGGSTGQDGALNANVNHNSTGYGKGGTQSAGGAAGGGDAYSNQPGSALQGGDGGHMGGGGGGGYYGGGAGGHTNGNGSSGSGGGSGYIGHSSVSNGTTTAETHTNAQGTKYPPQTSSVYYATGIGRGNQASNGGNGRIVIVY